MILSKMVIEVLGAFVIVIYDGRGDGFITDCFLKITFMSTPARFEIVKGFPNIPFIVIDAD